MGRSMNIGTTLARDLYAALNGRDFERFFGLLHPEVELHEGFLAPDNATYRGHEGVQEWLIRSGEAISAYRFEPARFMRFGDAVVIPIRLTAVGAASGVEVSSELVHVGRMREGKVSLLASYPDMQTALAATGSDVEVAAEPVGAAESQELLGELYAELCERYGHDVEPGVEPTGEDLAAFLVARDGKGRAVACGGLRPLQLDQGVVELKRMYVRPRYRGRGLGWAILVALEEEAQELGYAVVRLETGNLQPEATALYRTAGYREIPCYGPYAGKGHSRCFERRLV